MVVKFPPAYRADMAPWLGTIVTSRVHKDNPLVFLEVMSRLRDLDCLWWPRALMVEVDFEKKNLTLTEGSGETSRSIDVPFNDLGFRTEEFVNRHMRRLASNYALALGYVDSAHAIEKGVKKAQDLIQNEGIEKKLENGSALKSVASEICSLLCCERVDFSNLL